MRTDPPLPSRASVAAAEVLGMPAFLRLLALAIFLVGGDPTFPVFLYCQLRFAQRLPVLIAMAVLLMIGTVVLTLVAVRMRGRER